MTAADFRRLALTLPGAEERAHMNHPDFRVAGKIFATLGYPNASRGMVKLFPDQQAEFVAADPKSFVPVNGAWGRQGCTHVLLKTADKERVREAMRAAWERAAPKALFAKGATADANKSAPKTRRA
jgi:hypothetical protein